MSKNTKEIIILILLVFIGINYGIYQYLFIPLQNNVEAKKKEFTLKQQSISQSTSNKQQLKTLQDELEKLKIGTTELDNLVVKDIDSPQLIFDFYNACKKYEIKGENLTFDLTGSSNIPNTPTGTVNQNTSSGQVAVAGNQDIMLSKLSITLKLSGDKTKIGTFIRNLNTITKRKLNVMSINITSNTMMDSVPFVNPGQFSSANLSKGELSTDIVFYQYILKDGSKLERNENYDFYDGVSQVKSFSEMFK